MSLNKEILSLARAQHADIIRLRRDIHSNPEVGFDVSRTAGIAASEMKKLGLHVREEVGKTGVLADLIVNSAYSMIALRCELDALPMDEFGDCEYRSKTPGKAHMCGHDAHTAMLIGAARIISQLKSHLKKNVRFVFQPNEENPPGGAPDMIKDGALEGVREIFALHVWPAIEAGKMGLVEGPVMAQPDIFDITIKGRGGHAAFPHLCIDPIVIGAQLVNQLQTLVSRNVDPLQSAVLSVTQFHAGTTHNVIPESVFLQGTVRSFEKNVQYDLRIGIEKTLKAICEAADAEYTLAYHEGYPVTVNEVGATQKMLRVARDILGEAQVEYPAIPCMGGEDFAYYTQKIPACFYFLGIRNEAKGITHMCHDPRFDIDEDALVTGMALHAATALNAS